jgi:hypothetical protein
MVAFVGVLSRKCIKELHAPRRKSAPAPPLLIYDGRKTPCPLRCTGLAALCVVPPGHGFSYSEFSDALQARFTTAGDIPHYLYLAEHGFQSSGEKADLIVFYPLYPAVIWLVKLFCGSCVTAGLLISWAYWDSACVSMLELCLAEVRPLARRVGRSVAGALPILVLLDGCVYREPVSVTGRPMPLAHREKAVDRRGGAGVPGCPMPNAGHLVDLARRVRMAAGPRGKGPAL